MGFVQTIAIETSDIGPVRDLVADWHTKQSGVAPGYLSTRILTDRDQPSQHLILVDFSSAEEAAANNERTETAEWASALSSMIVGDAEFVQYDDPQ